MYVQMELMELQADSDLKEKSSDAEMLILCAYFMCKSISKRVSLLLPDTRCLAAYMRVNTVFCYSSEKQFREDQD